MVGKIRSYKARPDRSHPRQHGSAVEETTLIHIQLAEQEKRFVMPNVTRNPRLAQMLEQRCFFLFVALLALLIPLPFLAETAHGPVAGFDRGEIAGLIKTYSPMTSR